MLRKRRRTVDREVIRAAIERRHGGLAGRPWSEINTLWMSLSVADRTRYLDHELGSDADDDGTDQTDETA
jgi:hypothetical protein